MKSFSSFNENTRQQYQYSTDTIPIVRALADPTDLLILPPMMYLALIYIYYSLHGLYLTPSSGLSCLSCCIPRLDWLYKIEGKHVGSSPSEDKQFHLH